MIDSIAKKEFISTLRDHRFVALGVLVLLLLSAATVVGLKRYTDLQEERAVAQQTVNAQFANSADRHPHRMAHYGSYAFRPKFPLSFLDFGLDSYTGSLVYMEAHRQNSANFSQAQQSSSLIRFGEMTVAFVLQLLLPLLIIFLCFDAFTREKETGTLKILLSQGISMRQLAWAKIGGYAKVIALIVGPALVLVSGLLLVSGDFELTGDVVLRLAFFLLSYLAYFFIFIVLSVVVSALHRSSSTALVTLLGVWILCCVIVPKAAANLSATLYTTPTKAEMDAEVHAEVAEGINGHDSHDERADALKQELLEQYGVKTLAELPVNFDGILMASGEEHSTRVYAQHFDALTGVFEKQNRISEVIGLLNPYLAIRNLSMGMAGSDFSHYVHFLLAAEEYRYQQSQELNHIQATQLKYGDKETRLSGDTWKDFTPFAYEAPAVGWALQQHLLSLAALLLWLGLVTTVGIQLVEKSPIV